MRPLHCIHRRRATLAITNRKQAAASGGMACATTRPQGQDAPHIAAMQIKPRWVEYREVEFMRQYYLLISIHRRMSEHS